MKRLSCLMLSVFAVACGQQESSPSPEKIANYTDYVLFVNDLEVALEAKGQSINGGPLIDSIEIVPQSEVPGFMGKCDHGDDGLGLRIQLSDELTRSQGRLTLYHLTGSCVFGMRKSGSTTDIMSLAPDQEYINENWALVFDRFVSAAAIVISYNRGE